MLITKIIKTKRKEGKKDVNRRDKNNERINIYF